MKYFTQDFIDFFSELERNNNREWFSINKERYELFVKIPFFDFIQDLSLNINQYDEEILISPNEAIFRIYRDVRFSKDKSPYKTHASAVISKGGRKDLSSPGLYIELNHKGIEIYGGLYQLNKEQILRIRNYIAKNLDDFNNLLKDKDFKKYFGKIIGEKSKRLSPEFSKIEKVQPLIANKSFYYHSSLSSKKILSNNITEEVMKFYLAGRPLNDFLRDGLNL